MPIAARRITQVTFSLVITGLPLWAAFKLLQLLWSAFSQVNPTVGAGVIAAAATVLVSVISVLVAKRLEFRANVDKEHREKKAPFYEEMVRFIFRIAFAQKLGVDPVTEQEMVQKMAEFTENLVVWGSDDVIDGGDVVLGVAAVATLEEVDTAGASATFTTVQADSVLANHIHTHTHGALGEAGLELADEALAPFSFVLLAVFVVTADVGVTCCDVQVAVFNETLGLLLVVCHCCRCAQNPQSDQTHPLLQHILIFLITG